MCARLSAPVMQNRPQGLTESARSARDVGSRMLTNVVRSRFLAVALGVVLCTGCYVRATPPATSPPDAAFGRPPRDFDPHRACGAWEEAVGEDAAASTHVSFPELDPQACFVPVRYGPDGPTADTPTPGCAYPGSTRVGEALRREATRLDAIVAGSIDAAAPMALACELPADVRAAAARANARTLRALAARVDRGGRRWPYAAAATFGFGHPVQGASALLTWRPGDACPTLSKREMDLFSVNIVRAGRAAAAQQAGVAPVVIVSGGAVHSPLVEAFMLDYLVTCRFGVRRDAVLLDPCADHTHTNLRNTAGLLVELQGRTGYVVTDDGLQSGYLQEWTVFDLIGGSIDQRSLRDFGYLVGTWRQASVGMDAGFWLSPYRFWAAPSGGLRGFTCVR